MRWMTKSGGILCAFLFLDSAAALADDQFKGDGSMVGLMPDFAQDQGQPNKGICSAAAIADALWYLDQHGFGGLVAHTNANTPNTPWKNDAKALVLGVAEQIFGKDYVMNKQGARILAGMERGTLNYLRSKNFHLAIPNGRPALTVRRYDGANATYEWWQYYGQVNAFYPAVGDFTWRTAQGFPVTAKDGMGRDVTLRHAMTAAGRDVMVEKTFVTMGWKDHPADQPPYQKPPYGEDETPYIDTYTIQTMGAVGSRRMRLPKQDANLFNRTAAEFIALDAIDAIQNPKHQLQNANSAAAGGPVP